MENLPKFEVIGNASEEEKEDFVSHRKDIFEKQTGVLSDDERKKIEESEYPKTQQQISILTSINDFTNNLMQQLGSEPFDVPPQNYHIFPPKELKKFFGTDSVGVYDGGSYSIGLSSELRTNLLRFAVISLHETLHMKARQIFELYKSDKERKVGKKEYRRGVISSSPHKKDESGNRVKHFSGLDEAIIAWQEKISFLKILDIPELAEEKKKYESEENRKLRKKISEEKDIPEDEIFWVDSSDNKSFESIGYYKQRKVLEYVCDEILKEFSDEYPTREDVFREFLKVNFNSNLIKIARLMKQTFGDRGLRVLGMMKTDNDNGGVNNVLEMLRKMRMDIKRT